MNRTELISKIEEKTQLGKKESEVVLKAFLDTITEELTKGEEVKIVGFGTFRVAEVAERSGKIQLGENKGGTYTTPAHKSPKLKFSKAVKDSLNQ